MHGMIGTTRKVLCKPEFKSLYNVFLGRLLVKDNKLWTKHAEKLEGFGPHISVHEEFQGFEFKF